MRYPPYETDPFEDVWDNAVSDTAHEMSKDLLEMIEEKIREHAEEYFDIPTQWHDEIIDQKEDFIEEIVKEVMSKNLNQMKNLDETARELALITSIIINEDILRGTVMRTFDKAYELAQEFAGIYAHDFNWERQELEFDEAIIEFVNNKSK